MKVILKMSYELRKSREFLLKQESHDPIEISNLEFTINTLELITDRELTNWEEK